MINELKPSKLTFTKRAVVDLYEYCARQMDEVGTNTTFSTAIVLNEMKLLSAYNEIISSLYIEHNDAEYIEYANKHNEIVAKFADRNTAGEIIKDENGQPSMKEMMVEFNEAEGKLQEAYKDAIARASAKPETNGKILSEPIEAEIVCVDLDKIPNTLPPRLVGLFAGNVIKEALT